MEKENNHSVIECIFVCTTIVGISIILWFAIFLIQRLIEDEYILRNKVVAIDYFNDFKNNLENDKKFQDRIVEEMRRQILHIQSVPAITNSIPKDDLLRW